MIKNKMDNIAIIIPTYNELDNIEKLVKEIKKAETERQFSLDSKLMYKAASGCMEHLNIFEVSNINSTLKNLREKFFEFMVLRQREKKNLLKLNGREKMFFYLAQKNLG